MLDCVVCTSCILHRVRSTKATNKIQEYHNNVHDIVYNLYDGSKFRNIPIEMHSIKCHSNLQLLVSGCVCVLWLDRQKLSTIVCCAACMCTVCSIHMLFTSYETYAPREREKAKTGDRFARHTLPYVHMALIVHAANIPSMIFPATATILAAMHCNALHCIRMTQLFDGQFLSLSLARSFALSMVSWLASGSESGRTNERTIGRWNACSCSCT